MNRVKIAIAIVAALTVGASVAIVNEARPAEAAAQSDTVTGQDYSGSSVKPTGWMFNVNYRPDDWDPKKPMTSWPSHTYKPGELTLTATIVSSVDRLEVYPRWSGEVIRDGKKSATLRFTNRYPVILSTSFPADKEWVGDEFFAFTVYGDSPLNGQRTMSMNRADIITSGDILPVSEQSGPLLLPGGATVFR
jgi:hypothetical protein